MGGGLQIRRQPKSICEWRHVAAGSETTLLLFVFFPMSVDVTSSVTMRPIAGVGGNWADNGRDKKWAKIISVPARLDIAPDGALAVCRLLRLLARVYHWIGVWLQAARNNTK